MTGPLSVVIPVWNDREGLRRLLAQLAGLAAVGQVIVVDDASEEPADPLAPDLRPEGMQAEVVFLRNARQRGAGYARNRGLAHATLPWTLFLDSDDSLLPAIGPLLADLEGREFDVCVFAHADSRVVAAGGRGPLEGDVRLWQEAGARGALAPLGPGGLPHLIQISAYPWNKVYRTDFLREAGLSFTEIAVHNDVEIHWRSLLAADTILVSDRVCLLHRVASRGGRLTNREGDARLALPQAIAPILPDLARAGPDYALPFARFLAALHHWAGERTAPQYRARLHRELWTLYARATDADSFARVAAGDPELAARIASMVQDMPADPKPQPDPAPEQAA